MKIKVTTERRVIKVYMIDLDDTEMSEIDDVDLLDEDDIMDIIEEETPEEVDYTLIPEKIVEIEA